MTDTKQQRRAALAARRSLDEHTRSTASTQACVRLARLPIFRRARRIGLYWPMATEADPHALLAAMHSGQRPYLPRVVGQVLKFIAITGMDFAYSRSPLGMDEPLGNRQLSASALDLLIMPLAAFDDQARRIGMGGGYYDRTLGSIAHRSYHCPTLIGLAFEAQRVDAIQSRAWDVDLDAVVSERTVYRRKSHQRVG